MPQFLPFRGIRYDTRRLPGGRVDPVVAPPYDVVDDDERARLLARDDHNAVRLILPEGTDETRYDAAATDFGAWQRDGVLARDAEPAFYVYRMTFRADDGSPRHTLGVLGALAVPEPGDDGVLPHERTLPKAKSDRLALLRATRANLDPIWALSLTRGLSELLEPVGEPAAACTDDEGVEHALWPVVEPQRRDAIARAVGGERLVLADGHHRFETATAYRDELRRRGEHLDATGAGGIMTLVVELADDQVTVGPIHRLLTRLPDGVELRRALAAAFTVHDAGPNTGDAVRALQRRMVAEGGLGVVDATGLALAVPRPAVVGPALAGLPEPVRDVDAAVFEHVVVPALGGPDVVYRHDATDVAAFVDKGAPAAVLLRPVTVDQIRAVAFAGERMPQKTTFFHPKPRTGLVFRSLD